MQITIFAKNVMLMKRTIAITCLFALFLVQVHLPASAQSDTITRNNIYQIDDRLYDIYQRAERLRNKKECLAVYDTLKKESVRLGDGKAECLAYVGDLNYIVLRRDTAYFREYTERLMDVSRRNGYLQYFYFALSQTSTAYVNMGLLDKARECIDEMKLYLQSDDYGYGYYLLYNQMAHFSMKQCDYDKASELYLKAAHLCEEKIPDQIPVGAYHNAAIALMLDERYSEALECAKQVRKFDYTTRTRLSAENTICSLLFLMGRFDEFKTEYKVYEEYLEKIGDARDQNSNMAPALLEAVNGNPEKALKEMKESGNSYVYHLVLRKLYEMNGDYKTALALTDSLRLSRYAGFVKSMEYNVAENQTQLENMRLSHERDRLEIENSLAKRRSILMLVLGVLIVTAGYVFFYTRRMRENVKRLEKANAAKDVFVRNMSHEVRTPLNAVVGFSQLMAYPEMLTDEQRQEFSQYITDNGAMLALLIDDVLNSLDLESDRFKINIRDASPNTMGRMAVESTRGKVLGDVVMSFKSDVPEDYTFRTDPLRVQQMLQNMLNNACKNTETGSIVLELIHDEKEGKVLFTVTDTGCGIPADKAEKIFERFVKLDEFKAGSGMGLAICREISEKLGGTVYLDTTYTGGARFVLSLPE